MKRWVLPFLCGMLGLILLVTVPARGQSGAFIINNADQSSVTGLSGSQELLTAVTLVGDRPIVVSANTVHFVGLAAPSLELQAAIDQVSVRMVVDSANVLRAVSLAYPVAMMGDTSAPKVTSTGVSSVSLTGARIAWATDELATSRVDYGVQPGAYSTTVSDPLFAQTHQITLTSLTPGVHYYFRITCIDRSGNAVQSQELDFVFAALTKVYLPLLRR